MGGRRMGVKRMGRRKSCRKQQKRQQPQQQQPEQLCKRWWSRVPSQFGPPDWAAEQEQWRAEGAPMCDAYGEFGHDREDCPYGDPQYQEAWNQGLVGDAAEWFLERDQTQPTPKREEPKQLQPKLAPAEKECLLAPPQPTGEISWEAFLCTSHQQREHACWFPPLQPEGEKPRPPSQPEGEEPRPPSQPEGEEPLPPSPGAEQQELPLPPPPPPEGEEQELPLPPPLPPHEGEEQELPLLPPPPEGGEQELPLPPPLPPPEGEEQELPLLPPPPEGEEQELPLPSRQDGPEQEAGCPQLPLHRLLSRARGKTARSQRLRRGPTLAPPLVLAPLLQSPPEGPLPPSPPEGPLPPCRASPKDASLTPPKDASRAPPKDATSTSSGAACCSAPVTGYEGEVELPLPPPWQGAPLPSSPPGGLPLLPSPPEGQPLLPSPPEGPPLLPSPGVVASSAASRVAAFLIRLGSTRVLLRLGSLGVLLCLGSPRVLLRLGSSPGALLCLGSLPVLSCSRRYYGWSPMKGSCRP
ncbi:UNVERIFIED_CONTAM: hypothetical protein FKN15_049978 [Acipenser sinensis]